MMSNPAHFAFIVDEERLAKFKWEEIGVSDPTDRLLATIVIGGVPHHLEAISVQDDPDSDPGRRPDQVASSDCYADVLDYFRAADGATDSSFRTVDLRGRQYCLFMTPYSA